MGGDDSSLRAAVGVHNTCVTSPNYDEVRQDFGFKNVSLGNVLSSRNVTERSTFLHSKDQAKYGALLGPAFEVSAIADTYCQCSGFCTQHHGATTAAQWRLQAWNFFPISLGFFP